MPRSNAAKLIEELPVASGILKRGVNRKVLYVALLLHDIGKGRPEDHSILGAQIARKVAPRLGLKQDRQSTPSNGWYAITFSCPTWPRKRDIADPRTVRDFAKAVQTGETTGPAMLLLTVCDIRGVGPGTCGTTGRPSLIRALYRQTKRRAIEGRDGGADPRHIAASEAKKRNLRAGALRTGPRKDLQGRNRTPLRTLLARAACDRACDICQHAAQDWRFKADEIAIDLHPDEDRDATRACFALADHPGIFSRLAGALALVGANVVDARTYTSKDGFATAAFWIQDADGHPYETDRLTRLRQMIGKTLKGEVVARDAIKSRDKIKKRERAFRVPTHITFDNEGSEIYTIIEVDTRDRPGLLYDLTRTLANNHVYINSAVIATYGEQVVDTFYVKDMFGLKFHSESKRAALEKKLRLAITEGAERATA